MTARKGVNLRRSGSLRVGHRVGEDVVNEVDNTVPVTHKTCVSLRKGRVKRALEAAHAIGMSARMILDIELPDLT